MKAKSPCDITLKSLNSFPLSGECSQNHSPRRVDLYEVFCAVLYKKQVGVTLEGVLRNASSVFLIMDVPGVKK